MDHPIGSDDTALIEVTGPPAQQRVQHGDSILGRVHVPPWRRLVVDSPDDTLDRFARWCRADKGTSLLAIKAPKRIPEKVEGLFGYARKPSLPLIDGQTQPSHQLAHQRERCRTVAGPAANHEIVSVIDDVRIETRIVASVVPRQEKAPKVEVRKEWRCRPSLRGPSLPIASFCRAQQPSSGYALTHRRDEPRFEYRQHGAIGNPTGDTSQQWTVGDGGKVVAEISVHDLPSVVLGDVEVRATHCHLGVRPRPEPVLLRSQVRFEDGTEHKYHGGLDHTVLHGGYAQRSLATISLWNPDAQKWLWDIGFVPQLFPQRSKPLVYALSVDRLETDPIHTRGAGICPAPTVCFTENVRSADFVPKAVEPKARFGLRFYL
jgi:hypothetical protein